MTYATHRVMLIWNCQDVFKGEGTLSTCCDIALGHLRENFAGQDHKAWVGTVNYSTISAELDNSNVAFASYCDETGHAAFVITKI